MRGFSLFVGALSLGSSIAMQLDIAKSDHEVGTLNSLVARAGGPKDKGKGKAVDDGKSGSGRTPSPPKALSGKDKLQDTINKLRKFEKDHQGVSYARIEQLKSSDMSQATPRSGFTGWVQKTPKSDIVICYGDDIYQTADSQAYHELCHPSHKGRKFKPTANGKITLSQRRNFLEKFDGIPDLARDEVIPASFERGSQITVMPTSKWEGDIQGRIVKDAVEQARASGVMVSFLDTRTTRTLGYKGAPWVGRNVPGYNPPNYQVAPDGSYSGKGKGRNAYDNVMKRMMGVTAIQSQVNSVAAPNNNAAPDNGTSPQDISDFIEAFDTVQSNVTQLIWPVIAGLVEGTNSTDIHNVAWAVYQMALPNMNINSPFMGGLNSFDWIEDQMFGNGSNSTTDSAEYELTLAYHAYLEELYDSAWTNATALANATGLLDDLDVLITYGGNLNATQLPSDWFQANPDPASADADFFVAWNNGGSANDTKPEVADILQKLGTNSSSFPAGLGNITSNSTLDKRSIGRHARQLVPVEIPYSV